MPEICTFLEEMNRTAAELQLKGTFFDSPHGLVNWVNRSTAFDIARLSSLAMKILSSDKSSPQNTIKCVRTKTLFETLARTNGKTLRNCFGPKALME